MFVPECGPVNDAYTNVNGIVGCYHYLSNLGKTFCKVPSSSKGVVMCQAGNNPKDAAVNGISVTGGTEQSYW